MIVAIPCRMRLAVYAVALTAYALISGVAVAADNPKYAQTRARGTSWQGPYVGANVGYQFGRVSNGGTNPSGVVGGVQAGYNVQHGQFVFGGETDIQLSDADGTFAAWKFSNPWFGTLRGRAGFAMSNVLFYGTLGLAYGTLKLENTITGVTESRTNAGWAGGVGLEVALAGNWTARAEYLYVDLAGDHSVLTGARHDVRSNILRFGVNYRF